MAKEIQWEDGAVCYAYGSQWISYVDDSLGCQDFQLNEIRTQDFLPASELDTEQKYNDVVEVFGLFGFSEFHQNTGFEGLSKAKGLAVSCKGNILNGTASCKRKLTYSQVMAIGKLKRMMDERSKRADGFEGDCGAGEETGFSCDYYKVPITTPTTASEPYTAECNDVIEALDMTYAEANMFKEIWRTAAARTLGKQKAGHTSKRGAEKILFFAERHGVKHGVEK